jgi:hypothetical protein
MFLAIVRGSNMGPNDGWFGPAATRYTWQRLRGRLDADGDGRISRKEFAGPEELFRRLDRDGDGAAAASDLDWSDSSPFWQQDRVARGFLKRADTTGGGDVSPEEWAAIFEKAAKGKPLDADALRQFLFPPPPPRPPGPPPDMPSRWVLLKGLLTAEIGSPFPGPDLGAPAPDFTLKTHKGSREITLSDYRGKKPVVLIFGSFT